MLCNGAFCKVCKRPEKNQKAGEGESTGTGQKEKEINAGKQKQKGVFMGKCSI